MGFGDSLQGIRSVSNELGIINSNLAGANVTAHKSTTHAYGGTGSQNNTAFQTPDNSLVTSFTEINFEQGQIQSTGQQTDFAINGEGFFLLQQAQDVGVNAPNLLTRNGDFRFMNVPALGGNVLATANGLVVLRDASGTGAGPYAPITQTDFKNNGFLPSIVMPDTMMDQLAVSKKGSSVFEFNGGVQKGDGTLVQGSLEASNVSSYESLAAMSVAQKKFAAMATQLKVEHSQLDILTNFIR